MTQTKKTCQVPGSPVGPGRLLAEFALLCAQGFRSQLCAEEKQSTEHESKAEEGEKMETELERRLGERALVSARVNTPNSMPRERRLLAASLARVLFSPGRI